jgi:hypothetical protein
LLDQRELAAGRDINFQRCAAVYIDGVGRDLAGTVPNGEATVGQLEETLRAILAAL